MNGNVLTAQCRWWGCWVACHLVSPHPQRIRSEPNGERNFIVWKVNLFCTACFFFFSHNSPSPEWCQFCRWGHWAVEQTQDDSFAARWTQCLRECWLVPKEKQMDSVFQCYAHSLIWSKTEHNQIRKTNNLRLNSFCAFTMPSSGGMEAHRMGKTWLFFFSILMCQKQNKNRH